MPFTPGLRAVGFTQSKRRYPAFIEGLTLPVNGGGTANAKAFFRFEGEDDAAGITSVDLMDGSDIGVPITRSLKTVNVAVNIEYLDTSSPTAWTARLFKNGVEVATFAVATT